ncbi:MAG: FAD-dependent oxidoreductase [Chloroflexi bacterium]|nr:FAD-dependent oxidoreductase [Chloroflexota bacterium]
MREVEVLVVGGSTAGVAAARERAGRGEQTLLVDERPLDAAMLRRNIPYWFGAFVPESVPSDSQSRIELAPHVETLTGHSVWGVFPAEDGTTTVGVFDSARTFLVRAQHLVLATGAIDVDLAFPGSTLDGVLGGLGALYLINTFGKLNARRMVILGTGDLAREVGQRAREVGIEVVTIPSIVQAAGDTRLEEVMLTSPDGTTLRLTADCLCVALGRQPSIELAYLAGCPIDYHSSRGGYFARSTPAVTVVGDLAGITDGVNDGWHRLADRACTDETVICACENITRGQILAALPHSHAHPDEIKRLTRAGMGVCQGRGCRGTIASLIASRLGVPVGEVPLASYRPPVRPLPLGALGTEETPPVPACYAAFEAAEARLADGVQAGQLRPLALVRFRRAALESAYQCERDNADAETIEALARELERSTRMDEGRSR